MRAVTVHEFYHNVGLVEGLQDGQQLLVTAQGRPIFVVTKGVRPRMTRKVAEQRSIGNPKAAKFDGVAFLKSLKK